MIRRTLQSSIIGLLAIVAMAEPANAVPVEHIVNGGFEAGLTAWSCTGADICTTTTSSHSGSLAMQGFDNSGFATLSQTIATVPGETYDFSFWSEVIIIDPANILSYSLDGGAPVGVPQTLVYDFTADTFVASGTTALISFFFENDPGTGVWRIDDVSVTSDIAAVPEPLTLALFGAGLLGLGALRRRRKEEA